MAEIVLHHCVPVEIGGPFDPPEPVNFGFSIGGSAGDGRVDVSAPELANPASFPTNSDGFMTFPPVSSLTVHYVKSEDGADEIQVKVNVST